MLHLLLASVVAAATPTPIPLNSPTPLPYPAYGTPAPGVASQRAQAGVPQDITVAQAIAVAAAKSPVLAVARGDYRLTQLSVDLARTGLFPNITGSASYQRTFGGRGSLSSGGFGGGLTSLGLNGTLRQLIFDGGKVIAEIHQAQSNQFAGAGTYERQLETLAFNTAQAYYNALAAQAATQLDVQIEKQSEVQLALVNAQLRAGTASRVDVATAELPVAQARVALVRAQGTELSALATFAATLGLDPDTLVRPINDTPSNPAATLLPSQILDYDRAVARALALRPDFLSAQYAVSAAQYNVKAQELGYFPTISGSATYGTNSTSTNSMTNFAPGGSVGVLASIPIFAQGTTQVQVKQAQTQLDVANATLDQTKLTVELSVRQALVGLVSAQAAVAQTQAELSKAILVLSATQAQYRAGVTTLPLLLNAEVTLSTAQTDQLNAVYALRQAEQTYIYALGESDLTAP